MLSAQNRLDRQEGFSDTLRLGSRVGSRALVVSLRYPSTDSDGNNEGLGDTKVGIVVGKKQIPRAVDRNLVKRRLRHIMREKITECPRGSRVVVRALSPCVTMSFAQLDAAVDANLKRASLREQSRARVEGDS